MLHVTESTLGFTKGTITYALWNRDWTKSCDIDMTKEQFQKLKSKKRKGKAIVEHVSWMIVLNNSCPKKKTGIHAQQVPTVKELA